MISEPSPASIDAACDGDEQAAERMVRDHHARIFAFLRRLSGSETDAVDLTQQTFCRAWSARSGFAGRSSLSTWLHGIAYRTFVDWCRSRRPTEGRTEAWWEGVPDRSRLPDGLAADRDAAATVYAAVDALEPGYRDPVHLHYYQELTLEETAQVLGIATSTVKHRLREALAEVQRRLREGSPSVPTSNPRSRR